MRELADAVRVVRVSKMMETAPVDAPAGSGPFVNMVVAGWTRLDPRSLLDALHQIEARHGRVRGVRNAPRTLDLDLILYGAYALRSSSIAIPHPRYLGRPFVMNPLRDLRLPWIDPLTGADLMRGSVDPG